MSAQDYHRRIAHRSPKDSPEGEIPACSIPTIPEAAAALTPRG